VVAVGTIELSAEDAEAGWLTGWGGFAQMEVSDPSGRDWNGTAIHENLDPIRNTCEPTDACPNTGGEGGAAGSTFSVGEGTNLAGLGNLPGERNRFYDVHMFGLQGVSYLHALRKNTCTHWCRQHYDCGGRRFGPDFDLNRLMYKDLIVGAGVVHDVTRVDLSKTRV